MGYNGPLNSFNVYNIILILRKCVTTLVRPVALLLGTNNSEKAFMIKIISLDFQYFELFQYFDCIKVIIIKHMFSNFWKIRIF